MPIYAYRCKECGHSQDHLMKLAEAAPSCPICQSQAYEKQITSAAFALKGDGYYATDFKCPATGETPKPKEQGGCGGSCACH